MKSKDIMGKLEKSWLDSQLQKENLFFVSTPMDLIIKIQFAKSRKNIPRANNFYLQRKTYFLSVVQA